MSERKEEDHLVYYDPKMITTGQQMIASCSGALLTSLFMTPLDVVKIRLQAQQKPFHRGDCFVYCNGLMEHVCQCLNGNNGAKLKPWYKLSGHFNGTMDAFVKIARNEGIRSLWSGLPPTLIMAVPATMIYFTAYDKIKYAMGYREERRDTLYIVMAAGSIARIGAVTVISPLELIRTKLQSNRHSYKEICVAVRAAISSDGILSLWRGLGPTLLRDVPFSAIYWLNYEWLKAYQLRWSEQTKPTFNQTFLAGSISGTIAGILTVPFDVIKTHRQIELGTMAFKKDVNIESTWSLIRRLHAQRGVAGLFAGTLPRIAKVAPACAIMISSYEYAKKFFTAHNMKEIERGDRLMPHVLVAETVIE